jgi:hypothetical protein
MTPYQEALLAIEIAVAALHDSKTPSASDALEQIGHLGFDTRLKEEPKEKFRDQWTTKTRRRKQPRLFPD